MLIKNWISSSGDQYPEPDAQGELKRMDQTLDRITRAGLPESMGHRQREHRQKTHSASRLEIQFLTLTGIELSHLGWKAHILPNGGRRYL